MASNTSIKLASTRPRPEAEDIADNSAGAVSIRKVAFDAPWNWLAAGWRDLWTVPAISLTYGGAFFAVALIMVAGFTAIGLQSLVIAMAGGFLLVGPLFAIGLYEASRQLEAGRRVALADVLFSGFRAPGQLSFLGAILLFAFFAWMQIALLLFMLFMGGGSTFPPASEFVPTLLFTPHGLGLLVVGTVVGAIIASVVFSIAVISVPLLMTRRLDAVTAARASIEAVRKNPKPMALWAILIAASIACGLATLLVGLIVAFPLIGHATWHAYRDLVESS